MARIKDNNFYVTNGWMINRLGLTGRELQVYAIIYGFTQDGESEFSGSLNYIMEWLGTSSYHTALRAVKGLLDKKLIVKRQAVINGVKTNYYRAVLPLPCSAEKMGTAETAEGFCQNGREGTAETAEGFCQNDSRGTAETADNKDIDINNLQANNIKCCEKSLEKKSVIPYKKIVDAYNDFCRSFPTCVSVSENRKKAIAARWREYGGNIAVFYRLFVMAEESDFLKGKNDRNWSATFDWLLKSANMTKVLEGKYSNKDSNKGGSTHGQAYASTKPAEAWAAEASEYPDFDAMFG